MDHELRCLIAELCAEKSSEELERVLAILRARGDAALRETVNVLAGKYLSVRLQRAAIGLAAEVGGLERARLLGALLTWSNVDDEERAAAVRAWGSDTSSDTLALLLDVLAEEGSWDHSECGRAIVAHLTRVPADFDWAPVIGNVATSRSCAEPWAPRHRGSRRWPPPSTSRAARAAVHPGPLPRSSPRKRSVAATRPSPGR